jgi:uncharacterized membrane protein
MKKRLDPLEQYLLNLTQGLALLGPSETKEVLTEVSGHLAEAIADAGGDEAAALAQFDDPHLMAERILEERGLLQRIQSMRPPRWKEVLAYLAELLAWAIYRALALALVFSLVFYPVASLVGLDYDDAVASALWWTIYLLVLGLVTFLKRPILLGVGFQAFGLSRLRVGKNTLTVTTKSLPPALHPSGRRTAAIAWMVFAAVLVIFASVSIVAERESDNSTYVAVCNTMDDVSRTNNLLGDLYQTALSGEGPFWREGTVSLSNLGVLFSLAGRHASGELASYEILETTLSSEYWDGAQEEDFNPDSLLLDVIVIEDGNIGERAYTYHVKVERNTYGGATLQIVSVNHG